MFSKLIAVAAIAGLATASPQSFNAGDGIVRTVTTFTTQEITVTSCEPTVTLCPGVSTTVFAVTQVITPGPGAPNVNANAVVPSGATGTGGVAGAGNGNGNGNIYNVPQPTGYQGPGFTGAGSKMSAGGAVAAIGAVAALLI